MPESSPETRRLLSARLKTAGLIVLAVSLCVAPIYYWRASRAAEERLGDLLPGYDRAMEREMRIQMGPLGLVLMQWSEALQRPGTQALLIAVGGAVAARVLFFAARRVLEEDETG